MTDLKDRLRSKPLSRDCMDALARIEELEAALKPFADEEKRWVCDYIDAEPIRDDTTNLTVGDLRRARDAMEK